MIPARRRTTFSVAQRQPTRALFTGETRLSVRRAYSTSSAAQLRHIFQHTEGFNCRQTPRAQGAQRDNCALILIFTSLALCIPFFATLRDRAGEGSGGESRQAGYVRQATD